MLKSRLLTFVRGRLADRRARLGLPAPEREPLRSDALTLGFARRFATYKRSDILFQDLDRLDRLVNDPERPLQIVFAGKAHPRDTGGKALAQRVSNLEKDPRFAGRVVFVENYSMHVGRQLVQGVDAWLNTPRRPLEACGTSGQKCILNGVLNCSILDGWWAEALRRRQRLRRGPRRDPRQSRRAGRARRAGALRDAGERGGARSTTTATRRAFPRAGSAASSGRCGRSPGATTRTAW